MLKRCLPEYGTKGVSLARVLRERLQKENMLEQENAELKQKLAIVALESVGQTRQELALRKELHEAQLASEPNVLQLKQLLTDPAVNREFLRLASLAKSSSMEAMALREEMRAMHVRVIDAT